MKDKRTITITEDKSYYFLKIEEPSSDGYKITREKEFGTIDALLEDVKKVFNERHVFNETHE